MWRAPERGTTKIVTDTAPETPGIAALRRARLARRVLLTIFAAVLALGATGRLGVTRAEVRAEALGYMLTVEYPRVTRPGHAVPLSVEVRRPGGFGDQPVELRISTRYFALFDENGVQPAPSTETASGEDLIWEFDPPPGDVLRVYFDTRTGPNRQRGESGRISVLKDGEPIVTLDVRTTVMP